MEVGGGGVGGSFFISVRWMLVNDDVSFSILCVVEEVCESLCPRRGRTSALNVFFLILSITL